MRKEKFVRINTIEGYENIRDCYWISNSDEDKIINRDTEKQLKFGLNKDGYKRVNLMTKNGKQKHCGIHVLKAKAFLFGPNPLGYNVVRHLNDVKTDNRLENLAWGTQSDNMKDCIRNGKFNYEAAARGRTKSGKIGGTKNGAKNGKKRSKRVRCIETGTIYASACEASRQLGIRQGSISNVCNGKRQTARDLHFEFIDKQE